MPELPVIRLDDDGRLDELVAGGVHLEHMGDGRWSLRLPGALVSLEATWLEVVPDGTARVHRPAWPVAYNANPREWAPTLWERLLTRLGVSRG